LVGVGQEFNPRAPESDVVNDPDAELWDEGKRRDVLEMPQRDRTEEPVLGLAVKHHRPAPGLDAESRHLPHDTRRIVLRRFQACTGFWSPNEPIVTALPSPPPSSMFSPASQMWLY